MSICTTATILSRPRPWARWLACLLATVLVAACSSGTDDEGSGEDAVASSDVGGAVDEDAGTAGGASDTSADTGAGAGEDANGPGDDADEPVVAEPLAISAVTPSSGKTSGGETITIEGAGFVDGIVVRFGGTPLDADRVFVIDETSIQVQTPPRNPGLVDVTVVIPGDPAVEATLEQGFLYFNDVLITAVEPPMGPVAGGTPVAISGTGFTGAQAVLIGGKPAIGVEVLADGEIIAVTPPGVFGPQPVHVISDLGNAVLKDGYFYAEPPTITSVQPAAGSVLGGTQVVLHGTAFTEDAKVFFGQGQASVLEQTGPTQIKVATPPGTAGPTDVRVQTEFGTHTLPGGFVYVDGAMGNDTAILSIAPNEGSVAGGKLVTIAATGLVSTSDTTLFIGDKTAQIVEVSSAAFTVVAKTPKASEPGPVDVVLVTGQGTAKKADGYTYVAGLEISDVQPSSGPPEGNTKVQIKGSGFAAGSTPVVKIGALSATPVVVIDDETLEAVTPPGSAGYVDVAVKAGTDVAVLKNGFNYTSDELDLYVVYPDSGSQAGGSLVHVYGTGFDKTMEVRFGGAAATHLTWIDPTHVTVKTPPGEVGAVDVEVLSGGQSRTLAAGYSYYNPMSANGGTWGPEVDGTVNATILDASNGQPVPDAFTMLWNDPATPYQGYTDGNGQITFSGPGLQGKQMISASKDGYESGSVVEFDATNVTVYLQPIPPPSPGAPPPGSPPPTVGGKVIGLDKYVSIPVGNCWQYTNQPGVPAPTCAPCSSDASCESGGSIFACVDMGSPNGKRCLPDCSQGGGCPDGFACQFQQEGPSRCVPQAGELTAICFHSKPSVLARDNYPPEGPGFEANPTNGWAYNINTTYGEQAIVCFGGYKDVGSTLIADDPDSLLAFTATTMGVKRHLNVFPDQTYDDVNVVVNIPLNTEMTIRLDDPPVWETQGDYILSAGWAHMVFGADGVIRMPGQAQKFLAPFTSTDPDRLDIDQLPAALTGDIYDASLSVIGIVVQIPNGDGPQLPLSISMKNDIKDVQGDSMVRRLAGGLFESIETGVLSNIYGMWGTAANAIYGVGAEGALLFWSGNGWTPQAKLTDEDLRGVHGLDNSQVWAVGDSGAAMHRDGLTWVETANFSGNPNYRAVFATKTADGSPDVWSVATSGLYRLVELGGQTGWQKFNPSPYINGDAIHGSDANNVWAVGYTGRILYWNGQVWVQQTSGTSIRLRGVYAASPTDVFAVGEAGQILRYDGAKWTPMASPTSSTLYAVTGSGPSDVWAVGSKGVVLHYDGTTWSEQQVENGNKALLALFASDAGDLFAMGEQELLIGPMLYPPLDEMPKDGGMLTGYTLKWNVDETTTEPHFNYVTIGIPGLMGDTPVWNITTKGSLSTVDLPDFPAIQGTPGIPSGTPLRLTIIRGYKEGFDIDAYDLSDLNTLTWRSWATNQVIFTRP